MFRKCGERTAVVLAPRQINGRGGQHPPVLQAGDAKSGHETLGAPAAGNWASPTLPGENQEIPEGSCPHQAALVQTGRPRIARTAGADRLRPSHRPQRKEKPRARSRHARGGQGSGHDHGEKSKTEKSQRASQRVGQAIAGVTSTSLPRVGRHLPPSGFRPHHSHSSQNNESHPNLQIFTAGRAKTPGVKPTPWWGRISVFQRLATPQPHAQCPGNPGKHPSPSRRRPTSDRGLPVAQAAQAGRDRVARPTRCGRLRRAQYHKSGGCPDRAIPTHTPRSHRARPTFSCRFA